MRGQDVSEESCRPFVADAPDWFNRARSRTNQRPVFQPLIYQPRPVPPPRPSVPARGFFGNLWTRRHKALRYALPIAALPVVFATGVWMRGVADPAGKETASDGNSSSVVAPVTQPGVRLPREVAVNHFENPATERAVAEAPARSTEVAAVANQSLPPDVQPLLQEPPLPQPGGRMLEAGARRADDPESWGLRTDSAQPSLPADGFSLRAAGGVRHVSAEVMQPARAWFATATNEGECTTGSCPLPVARLDRRLNTALEWSSTPQAAADQAEREGKLVFLIHVSGNFAQPGFT
jgi:hypothetical protein